MNQSVQQQYVPLNFTTSNYDLAFETSPASIIPISTLFLPPSSPWSKTLIVVVGVLSYLLLSCLLCIVYRCARRHGMKPISCRCPPISSTFSCSCCPTLCSGIKDSACWQRPTPSLDNVLDKCGCCSVGDNTTSWFERVFTCEGMKCGDGKCSMCDWDKNSCFGPASKTPTCCRNLFEDAFCGYDKGMCRLCCLECKVRSRSKPGMTSTQVALDAAGNPVTPALIPGQYPFYPGMPFVYPNQAGIAQTVQQPYYFNNNQQPTSTTIPSINLLAVSPNYPAVAGAVPFASASTSSFIPAASYVPSWIPPRPVNN